MSNPDIHGEEFVEATGKALYNEIVGRDTTACLGGVGGGGSSPSKSFWKAINTELIDDE